MSYENSVVTEEGVEMSKALMAECLGDAQDIWIEAQCLEEPHAGWTEADYIPIVTIAVALYHERMQLQRDMAGSCAPNLALDPGYIAGEAITPWLDTEAMT